MLAANPMMRTVPSSQDLFVGVWARPRMRVEKDSFIFMPVFTGTGRWMRTSETGETRLPRYPFGGLMTTMMTTR